VACLVSLDFFGCGRVLFGSRVLDSELAYLLRSLIKFSPPPPPPPGPEALRGPSFFFIFIFWHLSAAGALEVHQKHPPSPIPPPNPSSRVTRALNGSKRKFSKTGAPRALWIHVGRLVRSGAFPRVFRLFFQDGDAARELLFICDRKQEEGSQDDFG